MFCFRRVHRIAFSFFLGALACQAQSRHSLDDDRVFHFVTRPEIRASRWNITVLDESQIVPGHWFVAPYEFLDQPPNVGMPGWIGPHIYDSNGELVWSGADMFDNRNIEDFRISNIGGQDFLTLLNQCEGTGEVIDNRYEIREEPFIDDGTRVNTHEFHFVDGGTRALVIKNDYREAPLDQSQEIGFDGPCLANYEHFQELDTTTWETTFDWDSMDHVRLSESTMTDHPIEERCKGWDFFHSNAVDKTAAGDYLYSSRHTDTIFKISGKDGHVIWRLGGNMSDFGHSNWTFSRQHNIRFRDQNATHMIVSLLDNARGVDSRGPTRESSRGLLLALDEEAMTVTILQQIEHPDGKGHFAPRRGNYQRLPGGNVFMGWSESAIQSEHAPDGTILMHARLMANWLGSYRNYKFNFTGRPTELPTVHSALYETDSEPNATVVHVSWNGATDVASWNLYEVTEDGDIRVPIGSAKRIGFESEIRYNGLASYVVCEAVDRNGEVLGISAVTKTRTSANTIDDDTCAAECDLADVAITEDEAAPAEKLTIIFFLGVFSGILTSFIVLVLWRRGVIGIAASPRWLPKIRYKRLGGSHGVETE